MTRRLSLSLVAATLVAASSAGAVPAGPSLGMPHFGRLLDNNDQPATGVKNMTFRIYDAATAGTKIWEGTYVVALSTQGVYAVTLGDADHPFDLAKLTGGDRWLAIQVEATTELAPRQQFGAVLYALSALDAKNVRGGVVENVQIKNSTLDAPTITGGTISGVAIDGATITGSTAVITGGSIKGVTVEATSIRINGEQVGSNSVAKAGDTMTGPLTAPLFISTAISGAPLVVSSSTVVTNLNSALLNGHTDADFVLKSELRAGGNLVHNGGFENVLHGATSAPNWFTSQAAFNASNSGISIVPGVIGNAVQLSDRDSNGRVVLNEVIVATATAALAGRKYSAGISFRGDFTPVKGELCIADAGPDNAETSKTCIALNGTTTWQRAQLTHTLSAAPAYLKVMFSATSTTANESADYQFDELAVLDGDGNAAYAAHPDDGFAGMIAAFASACPTGWSEYTAGRGRFLRGEPTGNAASLDQGGSDDEVLIAHTHGVTGTTDSSGAHTHDVSGTTSSAGDHNHSVDPPNTGTTTDGDHKHLENVGANFNTGGSGWRTSFTGDGSGAGQYSSGILTDNAGKHAHTVDIAPFNSANAGTHAHTWSGTSTSNGPHTHPFTTTSASTGTGNGVGKNLPSYQEMLFCTKE